MIIILLGRFNGYDLKIAMLDRRRKAQGEKLSLRA